MASLRYQLVLGFSSCCTGTIDCRQLKDSDVDEYSRRRQTKSSDTRVCTSSPRVALATLPATECCDLECLRRDNLRALWLPVDLRYGLVFIPTFIQVTLTYMFICLGSKTHNSFPNRRLGRPITGNTATSRAIFCRYFWCHARVDGILKQFLISIVKLNEARSYNSNSLFKPVTDSSFFPPLLLFRSSVDIISCYCSRSTTCN